MQLEFLADHKEAIPIVARWYHDEWGHLEAESTFDKVARRLHDYLNKNKIPLMILAVEDRDILGAAQLKYREMDIYPEKEHWLGGVYVSENHRGKQIAEKMVSKMVSVARGLGVQTLYLQTEHPSGGLYLRLGWQPIEQVHYDGSDVLVMQNKLTSID